MGEPIVVGVTDAPAAQRAVEWAVKRASAHRLPLKLIEVVGGAVGAVGEDEVLDAAVAAARERVEATASALPRLGLKVYMRVERGNPVAVLTEASARASLLVIGSDHTGGAAHRRGAHGLRIAAGAHCPVVVVPDVDVSDRSGVVVGVDGSPVSEKAVAFAAAEADRLGEPLIAVAVWTPLEVPRNMGAYPVQYLENMEKLTAEALRLSLAGLASRYPDLEIVRRVERGYPSHVINELAASARLAVVGSHGRGALARFLLGSISQEVLARLATVTAVVR
ncbi:universal stress protein [Microbacterium ureisolvens]|uniref:Universal stress protein n=1 Tax=Microbacterium ureisolvens TaxID=2781186 RepID=A0ABS7I225_9MICO|nr:universal stress protein [Microbacterium ureisolvens]MBW9111714.1 universal stress protein [Microbacterium ureisolvens]